MLRRRAGHQLAEVRIGAKGRSASEYEEQLRTVAYGAETQWRCKILLSATDEK